MLYVHRELFRAIRSPLLFLAFYTAFDVGGRLGYYPRVEELMAILEHWFALYGVAAVIVVSVAENVVVINAYFPGSVVILTAMASTSGDIARGLVVFGAIYGGALIGYIISFSLGRVSRSAKQSDDSNIRPPPRKMWPLFLSTYWHPHFAAITNALAGSSNVPFRRFLLLMISVGLLWNSLWGLTMWHVGAVVKSVVDFPILIYVYLVGWLLHAGISSVRGRDKKQCSNANLDR